jgi:hypothetical protein
MIRRRISFGWKRWTFLERGVFIAGEVIRSTATREALRLPRRTVVTDTRHVQGSARQAVRRRGGQIQLHRSAYLTRSHAWRPGRFGLRENAFTESNAELLGQVARSRWQLR